MAFITFQPSDYFNTVLYTGNGSTQSITGVGFQPDWLWIKPRSSANRHTLYDVLRGTNSISSDSNAAQVDRSADGFTSLDSDGFTLNGSGAGGDTNYNSRTHVAWNWKAGGAGSSNTDGTINTTSTSVNTTAGFSISTYTGTGSAATVGHGLGVAPKWIIMKNLDDSSGHFWVYHASTGEGNRLLLNLTNASGANTDFMNNTAPTTSVFSVKNESNNTSGNNIIAYCFAEKTGFSKFGSYTGNGDADGAFVYTGFKPAFLIVKRSSAVEDWKMFDNKRPGYNLTNLRLKPNDTASEASSGGFDFTSNGFKARSTDAAENASGSTYIYMAFAEEPLVSSNNIPATAR